MSDAPPYGAEADPRTLERCCRHGAASLHHPWLLRSLLAPGVCQHPILRALCRRRSGRPTPGVIRPVLLPDPPAIVTLLAFRSARRRLSSLLEGGAQAVRERLPFDSRLRTLLRRSHRAIRPRPPIDRLPPVIEEFARTHPNAFFIQIGSNDGEQLDPLRRAILQRQWSGIMVEPVPYVFERLRRNYEDVSGVILENAAIAERDELRELYHLAETSDPGLPQWYDALGSFRKEIVMKHVKFIPDIEKRVRTLKVPCLTFDSLCRKHRVSRVDVVQMDTEGYDHEIVKQIDFERYRPALVMFEHLHLGAETHRECLDLLAGHGYQAMQNGMDTLCLRVADLRWRDWRMRHLWQRLSRLEQGLA